MGDERRRCNLKHSFGQKSIVFFCDLSFISRSVEGWRVVIHVFDVDDDSRVVLVQVVRGDQTQLVLIVPGKSATEGFVGQKERG